MKKAEAEAKAEALERSVKLRNKKIKSLRSGMIALGVIIVALIGLNGFQFMRYQDLRDENTKLMNPQESQRAEIDRIKGQVEKLVDVPKDETPIIATVADVEKLKSQPFYANAQNGDKALFYEKSKRAILYRPSTNKIINTSSIDSKSTTPGTTTQPSGAGGTSEPTPSGTTAPAETTPTP